MHILFLSHYYPPEVNAPATRTEAHCRRWVRAGHRVTVVTCAPNCPNGVVYDGYRNCWRQEEERAGVRVIRIWTFLAANRGFLGRTLNFLSYLLTATWHAARLRDVDVVVATTPQFFCGWAGVLCRWIRRWPFVLEVRDVWPESIVAVGAMRRSPVMRLLEWLERRMYAAADRIVTLGDGYREQLLQRGVPAGKIDVVPNGVDLAQFPPAEPRQCSSTDRQFVCTYVGTVGMAHGLEVVLEAARELKRRGRDDVQFRIVGDGAERQRLQRLARRQQLHNVRFEGLIAKENIPAVIASSDACLVHLRQTELFSSVVPSKLFEIMALGVPIIIGVEGEARQIVELAQAGVPMTPEDPASLLDAIDHLAADSSRFGNARAYVGRHYDRDRLASRMLALLESQAAGRSARPINEPVPSRKKAA